MSSYIKEILYQGFGLYTLYNMIALKIRPTQIGSKLIIRGIIKRVGSGKVYIGSNVTINSCLSANPIGGEGQTILYAMPPGSIEIGNNVGISNTAIVALDRITIEDDVMIGGNCKIYDHDFHSLDYATRMLPGMVGVTPKNVHIKKGAFIGAHSIILKGVTIGQYSIIGAGSVVTKDVPDNEIWAGNPAKFIRKIKQGDNINHENNA